jgi:protein TonB
MKNIFVFCFILFGATNLYSQNIDTLKVYDSKQVKPVFPGDINKWLASKVYYPKYERDHNIHGTVYISFIIERNGSVDSVKVLKGVWFNMDRVAKEAVSSMPIWTPAIQDGQPVRYRCNIPIHFLLH